MPAETPIAPRIRPSDDSGTGLGRPWQVVVVNDDHNSFDYVIVLFCRILPGMGVEKAERLAWAIHTTGRQVVWSGHREVAEHYAGQLAEGGLRAQAEPAP